MSERLPPRPNDSRAGMTRIGAVRDRFNALVEGRPTRYVRENGHYLPNPAYLGWAARADAWAADNPEGGA